MSKMGERFILSITLLPLIGGIIGWCISFFMKGVPTKECIIFFAITTTITGLFTTSSNDE